MKTKFWIITLALTLLLLNRVSPAEAQCAVQGGVGSPDSNTKTQCDGMIATDLCSSCPGFNPQNLLKHVDPASGSRTPYFSRTGPGSVTDNMFGIVSGTDPGADKIVGTGDDIPTSRCGVTEGSLTNVLPGLNCGDIRFDPVSQGMVVPQLLGGLNNAIHPFASAMPAEADFCSPTGYDCLTAGTQKADAHMGIRLGNIFQWTGVAAGAGGAPPPPSISEQSERQVVSLTSGRTDVTAGTLDSPGSGDQVVLFTSDWVTTNNNETFTPPLVGWTQTITDPAPFKDAGGQFYMETSSSFLYQNRPRDIDPITLHDRLIPVVVYPQGPIGTGTTVP